jgi:hypothetical protein
MAKHELRLRAPVPELAVEISAPVVVDEPKKLRRRKFQLNNSNFSAIENELKNSVCAFMRASAKVISEGPCV